MSRASVVEHVQRLNMAVDLLKRNKPIQEVVCSLAERAQLSRRQAYRYVQKAQQAQERLPVPEAKAVFTVKLPESLIGQVRTRARQEKQSISQWVSQALQASLTRSGRYG